MDKSSRSFTVESIFQSGKKLSSKGGRYISSSPTGAAKKAFSHHSKTQKSLEIHLKETTQGSAQKSYKYKVSKIKEDTEVKRGNQVIHFTYKTKVKAI